jgi:hypothetical protein
MGELNSLFATDDSLPIPRVDVIDAVLTLEGGGAYYGLVIATPLKSDERSIARLVKKLERYVSDFFSPESAAAQGTPKPGKMRIYVNVHPDSDPRVFAILREYEPWIRNNGIKLIVSTDVRPPH